MELVGLLDAGVPPVTAGTATSEASLVDQSSTPVIERPVLPHLKRIIILVDGSPYSKRAIEWAVHNVLQTGG